MLGDRAARGVESGPTSRSRLVVWKPCATENSDSKSGTKPTPVSHGALHRIWEEIALSDTRSSHDRLAEVGILAAGLAHELNNPIGSILLAARNASAAPDRAEECLDTIRRNALRCASVVRRVLDVARTDPGQRESLDLNEIVTAAMERTTDLAGDHHATIQLDLVAGGAPVHGSAVELEQAIVNLISNAVESREGAHVRLETATGPDASTLLIEDNGVGIPAELRDRVFEPFFTTRQEKGGTGLGLSLVRAIAHAHEGRIELEDRAGEGTRVRLTLPRPGEHACNGS
ncbi:MAG: HAMP domain-containing sensor histidine kinase [Planctomycetota bacterium]